MTVPEELQLLLGVGVQIVWEALKRIRLEMRGLQDPHGQLLRHRGYTRGGDSHVMGMHASMRGNQARTELTIGLRAKMSPLPARAIDRESPDLK
jgi:hypothetical protein